VRRKKRNKIRGNARLRRINRELRRCWVKVEHAIGFFKTYGCISGLWRHRRAFLSIVIHLSACLSNRRRWLTLLQLVKNKLWIAQFIQSLIHLFKNNRINVYVCISTIVVNSLRLNITYLNQGGVRCSHLSAWTLNSVELAMHHSSHTWSPSSLRNSGAVSLFWLVFSSTRMRGHL
jgi:hypothetical protein